VASDAESTAKNNSAESRSASPSAKPQEVPNRQHPAETEDAFAAKPIDVVDGVREFVVVVERIPGSSLGVDLTRDGSGFIVNAVDDGSLISDWNKAEPDQAVLPGHKLVGVNGQRDDANNFIVECSQHQVLRIIVNVEAKRKNRFQSLKGLCQESGAVSCCIWSMKPSTCVAPC